MIAAKTILHTYFYFISIMHRMNGVIHFTNPPESIMIFLFIVVDFDYIFCGFFVDSIYLFIFLSLCVVVVFAKKKAPNSNVINCEYLQIQ